MRKTETFSFQDWGRWVSVEVEVRAEVKRDLEPPTHSGGGSWEDVYLGRVVSDTRGEEGLRVGQAVYAMRYGYGGSIREDSVTPIPWRWRASHPKAVVKRRRRPALRSAL